MQFSEYRFLDICVNNAESYVISLLVLVSLYIVLEYPAPFHFQKDLS